MSTIDPFAVLQGQTASEIAESARTANHIVGNFDAVWTGMSHKKGEGDANDLFTFWYKVEEMVESIPVWHRKSKDIDAAIAGFETNTATDFYEFIKGQRERASVCGFLRDLYTLGILGENGTWERPSKRAGRTVYLSCTSKDGRQNKNISPSRKTLPFNREDIRVTGSEELELYLEEIEKKEGGEAFIKHTIKLIKNGELTVVRPGVHNVSIAVEKFDEKKKQFTLILASSEGRFRVYLNMADDKQASIALAMSKNLPPTAEKRRGVGFRALIGVGTSNAGNDYNTLEGVFFDIPDQTGIVEQPRTVEASSEETESYD